MPYDKRMQTRIRINEQEERISRLTVMKQKYESIGNREAAKRVDARINEVLNIISSLKSQL